ncbi:protein kinase C-like 1B [Oppia nitens]|uniref:protein kinase C-like 1B n=1 Tax=Oppia nitens TaxID=1686743 RepID=UPI0023DB142B|nr:protein kinase C-like 1B [Oppia nitens]
MTAGGGSNDRLPAAAVAAAEFVERPYGLTRRRRRGAIRRRMFTVNGHRFLVTILRQPTQCTHCRQSIHGLRIQGYHCRVCSSVVHKKCHQLLSTRCNHRCTDDDEDDGDDEDEEDEVEEEDEDNDNNNDVSPDLPPTPPIR